MNKAHIRNIMDFEYPKVTMTYGHVIYFGAKFQKKMKKGSVFVGFLGGEKPNSPKQYFSPLSKMDFSLGTFFESIFHFKEICSRHLLSFKC
jgi:hypothetical protein